MKSKGIHDPWRLGTDDWEPPKEEAPAGAKGSKLPFDWDLQPEKTYVLRHQGVALKIIGANEPTGAVAVLIRAFVTNEEVRRILTEAGFEYHDDGQGTGFALKIEDHVLCCPTARDTRDGLHRCCQALRQAIRADRTLKRRLQKLGIVPLIQ